MDLQTWVEKINSKGKIRAEEIRKSLQKEKHFGGILPLDKLDDVIINSYPVSFIVIYKKHWIAFYITKTELEIFDSVGKIWKKPPKALIHFICSHNRKKLKFNRRLQSKRSNICGLYAILFVKLRNRLWKWSKIQKFFTKNDIINDSIVSSLISCKIE